MNEHTKELRKLIARRIATSGIFEDKLDGILMTLKSLGYVKKVDREYGLWLKEGLTAFEEIDIDKTGRDD